MPANYELKVQIGQVFLVCDPCTWRTPVDEAVPSGQVELYHGLAIWTCPACGLQHTLSDCVDAEVDVTSQPIPPKPPEGPPLEVYSESGKRRK